MKRLTKTILAILSLILFTSCSQKVIYIAPPCPYIEPKDINITTNSKGGLSPKETSKVFKVLRYYKKETIRLKQKVHHD